MGWFNGRLVGELVFCGYLNCLFSCLDSLRCLFVWVGGLIVVGSVDFW